jgi:hypothetical protein
MRGPKRRTRRRRAGRKKLEGEREPSGRLSRRKEVREKRDIQAEKMIQSVVTTARMRHYGITEEQARNETTGYLLGRLHLNGALGNRALEAGNRLGLTVAKYYALQPFSAPHTRAVQYLGVHGRSVHEPTDAAIQAATREYDAMLGAIGGQDYRRYLLVNVAFSDMGPVNWSVEHLYMLRSGLSRLADYLKLPDDTG